MPNLLMSWPAMLAVEMNSEVIIASVIFAVGAVIGIGLIAKPSLLFGSPTSGWGRFAESNSLLVGTLIRVAGLLIIGGAAWYAFDRFQQQRLIAQPTETETTAPQEISEDVRRQEHDRIMSEMHQMASGQYESIEIEGTQLYVWTHPPSGEKRVYTLEGMVGASVYLEEDLADHLRREHDQRNRAQNERYPLLAYDLVRENIVPNIFPPPSGSPIYQALHRLDPEAAAPWKNLRILFYIQQVGNIPESGEVVRQHHLRRWGKSPTELWSQAVRNLERIFNENKSRIEIVRDGNLVTLTDPSLLISAYPVSPKNFHRVVGKVVGGGEFYFAIPTYSRMILLSTEHKDELPKLVEKLRADIAELRSPVSRSVYLSTPDDVQIIQEDATR